MATDPSIIPAIAAAVESSPDNTALRLHLATLLMDADRPAEALDQCTFILGREPDNPQALHKAADAAFKMGDTVRAISYGRLLDALGSSLLDASELTLPPLPDRREPLPPTPKTAVPLPSLEADQGRASGKRSVRRSRWRTWPAWKPSNGG